jgi:HKD family nuclease
MIKAMKFLRGSQIAQELRNSIDEAETIKIAVAFLKGGGYHEISANLKKALGNGKSVNFVVGACTSYHITDPQVLHELMLLEEMYRPNFQLGVFSTCDFHPKLFILQKNSDCKVIVGSSNLTSGGTSNNIEANILIEGKETDKMVKEIIKFFDNEVLPKSYVLSNEYIQRYKKAFNTYASVKRTKQFRMPTLQPKFSPQVESDFPYRLYLENIQSWNEPRTSFDKKHRISKQSQGAVYSRDPKNQIDGIVVLWPKSKIEQYFPDKNHPYLDIGRYLNLRANNFRQGMDVYLVETKWDTELGTKKSPWARAFGKLRSQVRTDVYPERQIFP